MRLTLFLFLTSVVTSLAGCSALQALLPSWGEVDDLQRKAMEAGKTLPQQIKDTVQYGKQVVEEGKETVDEVQGRVDNVQNGLQKLKEGSQLLKSGFTGGASSSAK
ncbi:MAG: hypothetical protein Greene041619_513 [Candidatus Peregrinibacteria bacterium Greene0416_19]|nr:MAG: hypothetical protein Greene041619_513 [Candidatus Peregrinibacteria bacterium Greene0416_19]